MKLKEFLLILIASIPAGWYLFGPGYYNMHDDLQVMRIFEMEKCLRDGQIPCRWSPDMAYGYGQAMFNFYSAFPYYFGVLIRILTFLSIIATVKFTFFLSILFSGLGMYLLAREFWGRLGGFVSSVLYIYAPYHALDVFVRGALAESWAIAILPWLWLSIYKLVRNPNFLNGCFLALNLFLLLTTHNVSTLIYFLPSLGWGLFWLLRERKLKSFLYVGFYGILGLGLSAFFIIPAIYETRFVQIDNLKKDYSDYHAHFVSLNQLFFERKWGDGPSIWGPEDDISFQIGWPHWWIVAPAFIFSIWFFLRKKRFLEPLLIFSLIFLFLLTSFLTHPRSVFIWEKVPLMAFVQFPWRFLALVIFSLSFLGGFLVWIKYRGRTLVALILVILTFLLNISYFKPIHFSRLVKDEDKLTGLAFELQQKAAIVDYLPKTAEVVPPAPAPESPNIIEGDGHVWGFSKGSNRFSFEIEMYNEGEVVVPVMYFPGWIVILDSNEVPLEIHGAHGVIKVKVPLGKHSVRGRFTNTPIRSYANGISLFSAVFLFSLSLLKLRERSKLYKDD